MYLYMTEVQEEIEKIELTYLEHNKFKGFGEYKNEVLKQNENRINELMEQCKKEFPNIDNYLLWVCACDYMMEELGIKNENNDWEEVYKKVVEERKNTLYETMELINLKNLN